MENRKMVLVVQNINEWFKIVQNGSTLSKMIQTVPEWSNMLPNVTNCFKWSVMSQIVLNGHILSKMVPNDPIWKAP